MLYIRRALQLLGQAPASSERSLVRPALPGPQARCAGCSQGVSVLVNNAGVVASFGRPPLEADVEDWDTMLAVNLAAPMRLVRLLGPGMVGKRDPVILNISSISGVDPVPNSAGYATSKWDLTGCAGLLAASLSGLLAASLCKQSRPACCR